MASIQSNRKANNRVSVTFLLQRIMFFMVATMATMTFTACPGSDENGDDENGGSSGGFSGKRVKNSILTTTSPKSLGIYRVERSYNSDGTLKQMDSYDKASNLVINAIFTNNPDGTRAKIENNYLDRPLKVTYEYIYDSKKTLQKAQVYTYTNGTLESTTYVEYTFENGKKIREVLMKPGGGSWQNQWEYSYDSNGRRTITTMTNSSYPSNPMKFTRTYNADGTINKVTYPIDLIDDTPVTETFTWENGKTTVDEDIFFVY
jgi:hypothetical protein